MIFSFGRFHEHFGGRQAVGCNSESTAIGNLPIDSNFIGCSNVSQVGGSTPTETLRTLKCLYNVNVNYFDITV